MKLQDTAISSLGVLLPLSTGVLAQAGVTDFVLGQLCNSETGPGTDPTITICNAELVAQNSNGDTVATASLGIHSNPGQDNYTEFCSTYAADLDQTVVLTIDEENYDFGPFTNCKAGDSVDTTEVEEGTSNSTSVHFFYDPDADVGFNPAAGVFHPAFLAYTS